LNTKKQGKNEIKINYFRKLTKRAFYEFININGLEKIRGNFLEWTGRPGAADFFEIHLRRKK